MPNENIIFEQPVSERVRTLLRLEFLFARLAHHRADDSEWGLRASVDALVDVLSLFSRNDLKTEILRELNDKQQALDALSDHPGVDLSVLKSTLTDLASMREQLQGLSSQQISQALKDSDFLLAIIQRSTIPGGTGPIDMPGYHHWLHAPDGRARRDLDHWIGQVGPFEQAVGLYLRLLRQSSGWQQVETGDGMYVHGGQDKFQLIRIRVDGQNGVYPEISAGRQRFTVRLVSRTSARDKDVRQVSEPLTFGLSLCSL